jgi:hypothetical protein
MKFLHSGDKILIFNPNERRYEQAIYKFTDIGFLPQTFEDVNFSWGILATHKSFVKLNDGKKVHISDNLIVEKKRRLFHPHGLYNVVEDYPNSIWYKEKK